MLFMKRSLLTFCCCLVMLGAGCVTQRPLPTSTTVQGPNNHVPLHGKFETLVEVDASYSNAFDPRDISVDVEFTSPSGIKKVCPAFLYSFSPAAGTPP